MQIGNSPSMFSSRNIHFAILGIILGAAVGYILAFYQVAASAPPAPEPAAEAASPDQTNGMPANHPEVTDEQMLALLKKAAEDSPNEPGVLSRYANELFQLGRIEESADWYKKVVALEPKDNDVRSLYGAVLWKTGKKTEAMTQFQAALAQDPKHVPSMHGMFFIALDNHDVKKATDWVRQIEQIEPDYQGLPDLKKRLAQETAKPSK